MKIFIKKFINQLLICTIIFLLTIIVTNIVPSSRDYIKNNVFNNSINFFKFNKYFKNIFMPKKEEIEPVITGNISKIVKHDTYLDGIKLTFSNNNTNVSALNTGIIVYIGDKDNYKNLIIVQGFDGNDIWYGMISDSNYKLYDYVSKNDIIGQTIENELILVGKSKSNYINMEKYLNEI